MTDFFDEKARQVDVDSLTAFNIQLTSRYAKARELACDDTARWSSG